MCICTQWKLKIKAESKKEKVGGIQKKCVYVHIGFGYGYSYEKLCPKNIKTK